MYNNTLCHIMTIRNLLIFFSNNILAVKIRNYKISPINNNNKHCSHNNRIQIKTYATCLKYIITKLNSKNRMNNCNQKWEHEKYSNLSK